MLAIATAWPSAASGEDPCAAPRARSLVLSGGGAKGAFEAGAIYHLVVHRGCDFTEISGNSVGAINGALLAQAAATGDPSTSLASLGAAAERLVEEWTELGRAQDVVRTRPLGKLRFALLGLDSVADLNSLRQFVRERVSLEKLAAGRELRVGYTAFGDGRYREAVINAGGRTDAATAHEVIFGSAVVPVFGRMPLIESPTGPLQLADGGLRHATPVTSFFLECRIAAEPGSSPFCVPLTGAGTPPHPPTEQLFVVVTSPFQRRNDTRPVIDANAFDRHDGTISDGRQVLVRTFDLLVDTMYRDDLDDMWMYNDLLEWNARAAEEGGRHSGFPLGSYRPGGPNGARSLPYEIVLVGPRREDTNPMTIFDLEPATQRRQLFCGCIAADDTMRTQFGLETMADSCVERFKGLAGKRDADEVELTPMVCRDDDGAGARRRR